MLDNDEARYQESRQHFVISYDGLFTFSDVYDWIPTNSEDIIGVTTQAGRLYTAKTGLDLPYALTIVAIITRQQRIILEEYRKADKKAMILLTNTKYPEISYKYSETSLKAPEFDRKVLTPDGFRTELFFMCSKKTPA